MIYVLIWRTCFHCIVFLHNGLQITGGSDSVSFPLLLWHAAEFLNQHPALGLLIYKSNSFSVHCLKGAYFFLFHKEDFCFHYRRRKKDYGRKLKKYHHHFLIKIAIKPWVFPFPLFTFFWHEDGADLQTQFLNPSGQRRLEKIARKTREDPPANQWHPWYPTRSHFNKIWNIQIKKENYEQKMENTLCLHPVNIHSCGS